MRLQDRLRAHGGFLFRWRGVVPLALLPLVALALPESERIDAALGEHAAHGFFLACLALSYGGLGIRFLTAGFAPAGTSGRNTRGQRAAVLVTTGPYSVVRNPLYVGNFIAMLGIVVSLKVWWLVLVFLLAYALYIERVVAAEEAYLSQRFGAAYQRWVAVTPAFVPQFSNWRRAEQAFSLRSALRREYSGVMAVASAYLLLELATDIGVEGEHLLTWVHSDRMWVVVAAVSAALYLALRFLKRYTRLLVVQGR